MTIQEYIDLTGESPIDILGEDWELILKDKNIPDIEKYPRKKYPPRPTAKVEGFQHISKSLGI